MAQIVNQIEQRDQDEGTTADARMGDLELWLVDDEIVVEEQVNVDQPRPPDSAFDPTKRALQALEPEQ